ncbi:MAG TPA: zf-HC2 domain-containing protein [Actinocrinis sp.]|uniref:anti-sigma factor family protein n=1 Tax=Actinocrinis sp. TaxID=1920516 RepID=UPI002D61243D|nr:zf-HC2 domain-containing protein [Actinocrinis sp.]HZU58816.1 zf-HC2 domain-containing protein [Actinocrinis sp.]
MTDRSHAGAGSGRGRTGPPGYPPGYPPAADSCSPDQRIALGSYALGALDPAEADQVRTHLVDCAACRAEYRELAAVPAVLARITETEMAAGPVPPDGELLTRLLEKAAAREASGRGAVPGSAAASPASAWSGQGSPGFAGAADPDLDLSPGGSSHSGRARRRRPARQKSSGHQKSGLLSSLWSGSLVRRVSIAAAGGVLAAAAVISVYAGTTSSGTPVTTTINASNAAMGITGQVKYHATEWGSWVQVTMHNVPPGDDCMLLAVDNKGNRVVASTWWAPSSGTATIPGGVAMEADEIMKFQVVTATGKTLLDAPVH